MFQVRETQGVVKRRGVVNSGFLRHLLSTKNIERALVEPRGSVREGEGEQRQDQHTLLPSTMMRSAV